MPAAVKLLLGFGEVRLVLFLPLPSLDLHTPMHTHKQNHTHTHTPTITCKTITCKTHTQSPNHPHPPTHTHTNTRQAANALLARDGSSSSSIKPSERASLEGMTQDALLLSKLSSFILKPVLGGVDGSRESCDLEHALQASAATSHILLVIFRTQKGEFMPAQLYHDMQSTIKSLYVDTARLLLQYRRADLNFFLLGTNELEKLFGILRSLFTGRGFDIKELGERIGATIDIHRIKSENPRWAMGSKRLSASGSHDSVNIKSWLGKCSLVGEAACLRLFWEDGRKDALAALAGHPYYGEVVDGEMRAEAILKGAEADGSTMMRALGDGKLVGVGERKDGKGAVDAEDDVLGGSSGVDDGEKDELLRKSSRNVDDEGGLIVSPSGEVVDAAEGLEIDLTDMLEDDRANATELLRPEGGDIIMRSDKVWMVMAEGGEEVYVSKATALTRLGKVYDMNEVVKSSDRTRRVAGFGKSSSSRSSILCQRVVEEETELVGLFDPVIVYIKSDTTTEKGTTYVTMSIAVGVIASLSNTIVGGGSLQCLREELFAMEETTVEVHLVELTAAEEEGFVLIKTNERIAAKPLSCVGNVFIALVKPQVVENTTTGESFFRLKKTDLEVRANVFATHFKELAVVHKLPKRLPHGPSYRLLSDIDKKLVLKERVDNKVVCCVCKNPHSVMINKQMRQHVGGHLFLPGGYLRIVSRVRTFRHPCGFCGESMELMGCTIGIKYTTAGKRVLESSCGMKLDGMKFTEMLEAREEELSKRVEAGEKGKPAGSINLDECTVSNIPVVCPMNYCNEVVWKYNIMAHILDDHADLFGQRNTRWRREGGPLVEKFFDMLSDASGRVDHKGKGKNPYKMKAETAAGVRNLVKQMRELVPDKLGISLAFNMEEMARESASALAAFYSSHGPLVSRAGPRKKKKQMVGGGAERAEQQAAGGTTEVGNDDGDDDGEGEGGGASDEGEEKEEEKELEEGQMETIIDLGSGSSDEGEGLGMEVSVEIDAAEEDEEWSSDSDEEHTRTRKRHRGGRRRKRKG